MGFVAGKAYYTLIVFGEKLFTRGSSKRYLLVAGAIVVIIFWAYSALLYLDVVNFPWPFPKWFGGTDWMLNSGLPLGLERTSDADIFAVVVFATYPLWFYLGTEVGLSGSRLGRGARIKERNRIITELVKTSFPEGGAIPPSAEDVHAEGSIEDLLARIPPFFSDSMTIIMFVFDSRFFVYRFTGKWKRFVDLDSGSSTREKRNYLNIWESNNYFASIAEVFKLLVAFGYYTKPAVYKRLGYDGPQVPNFPSWYKQGPAPKAGQAGGTN